MRKIGILAGGALLAIATSGVQAQAPLAGAYYGSVPGPAPTSPAYSAWAGAPAHGSPHIDRKGYRAYERGARMGDIWRDPTYAVNDWQAWGLGQPGPGMHWVRYYDDAVLVDAYGTVVDCRHGVNWDGPRMAPVPGPVPSYAGGPAYPGPGTTVTRVGPNTTVTTQVIGGGGGACCGANYAGGAYPIGPGYITITPGSVVTTTTTTTTEETVYKTVARKRVYRRPVRHYRPRCVKAPTCPVQGS